MTVNRSLHSAVLLCLPGYSNVLTPCGGQTFFGIDATRLRSSARCFRVLIMEEQTREQDGMDAKLRG